MLRNFINDMMLLAGEGSLINWNIHLLVLLQNLEIHNFREGRLLSGALLC